MGSVDDAGLPSSWIGRLVVPVGRFEGAQRTQRFMRLISAGTVARLPATRQRVEQYLGTLPGLSRSSGPLQCWQVRGIGEAYRLAIRLAAVSCTDACAVSIDFRHASACMRGSDGLDTSQVAVLAVQLCWLCPKQ